MRIFADAFANHKRITLDLQIYVDLDLEAGEAAKTTKGVGIMQLFSEVLREKILAECP